LNRRQLVKSLIGSCSVVIIHVSPPQVCLVDDQKPIQAFVAHRTHPLPGKSVSVGRTMQRQNRLDAFSVKHHLNSASELGIPFMWIPGNLVLKLPDPLLTLYARIEPSYVCKRVIKQRLDLVQTCPQSLLQPWIGSIQWFFFQCLYPSLEPRDAFRTSEGGRVGDTLSQRGSDGLR